MSRLVSNNGKRAINTKDGRNIERLYLLDLKAWLSQHHIPGHLQCYRSAFRSMVFSDKMLVCADSRVSSCKVSVHAGSPENFIPFNSNKTMLIKELETGLKATTEILVGTRDTAFHIGSGKIKVLATPVMVMLLEEAALNAVEGFLAPGFQTVGTRLDVSHLSATPVGMRVTAYAELTEVDGRKLTFRVWADDEKGRIGVGIHKRIIVDVKRFDERVSAKLNK